MSFYDAIRVGASGAADFEIKRSLRFNRADTNYIERTPSSNGNKRTWTFSAWIKRGQLTSLQTFFSAGTNNPDVIVKFTPADQFEISRYGGSYQTQVTSTQLFRDPSAWYHIVGAVDTTQATASNRVKMYVNGTQITDFANSNYPSQNYEYPEINDTGFSNKIGKHGSNSQNFDGYMAEINFIDGLQLTPSSFAETNADTGQWVPIDTSGLTFGTNGFRLQLSDNSGTTATTLGKDTSGNGNNFTPYNFSVAAGAGNDSLEDTPTNNFPTINPISGYSTNFLSASNANLDFSMPNNHWAISTFPIPASGKWYAECVFTDVQTGDVSVINPNMLNDDSNSFDGRWNGIAYKNAGYIRVDNTQTQGPLTAISNNAIVGIKIDRDAGTVAFTINGVAQGNAENISSMTDSSVLVVANRRNSSAGSNPIGSQNYGQRPFSYLPAGFKALNSKNIPDPTILLPNQHFNTVLYSGDGNATKSITGIGFKPGWLWLKGRNTNYSHLLYDAVRGAGSLKAMNSNETRPEGSTVQDDSTFGFLNSFDSDGFSVTKGSDSTSYTNGGSSNYVAWNWYAGETDSATYRVVVVSDSGNKYRFRNSANTATFAQSAVTLNLAEGGTYTFDQSDSTMSSHPMKLSTTANGTHGGGSSYNTGVTYELDGSTVTESAFVSGFSSATSRKLIITVAASAPTLYYYCHYHSGMGGQANTNSTAGSSNFDGSIQTTVKANTTAGFSIVTYTGTGSAGATIGHGLGVTPDAILIKRRDAADNWMVYHNQANAGVDPEDYYGELNSTSVNVNSTIMLNDTAPTSTSITLGGDNSVNGSSATYVSYVFSEVAGYSKFNKYFGVFNDNGPMVYTGFRPAWLMVKQFGNDNWYMVDNKRDPINVMDHRLFADVSSAEGGVGQEHIDFLSNGFKWRKAKTPFNNAFNYIYFCFAEAPFKNSRAR